MIVLSKNINRNDKHCLMKTIDSAFFIVKEERIVYNIKRDEVMDMYYYLDTNIPVELFQRVLKKKIYIDKSMLINKFNEVIGSEDCYFCITRPRRFGKTMNANMLGAYYTQGYDTHELFKDLKIAQTSTYEEHINKHHVVYIDFRIYQLDKILYLGRFERSIWHRESSWRTNKKLIKEDK